MSTPDTTQPATGPQAVADLEPDPSAILAAEIEARLAEVAQETIARLEARTQAEKDFLIEADGDIARARQDCAAYATVASQGIHGMLDDASAAFAAMCSRHGARAAA